jgi:tetratricopeptide (TPR) repeat protein/tRNA A-37 threonylcarbamoyl transferase component Bud32
MSRVFLAEERALGRKVVIKALPPEIAASISVDRFRREVQLAASLQHPHIVPVLASGDAGGVLWYSMPHVEGQSLRSMLERDGALPSGMVVRLLRDVADALEHAHGKGVVHRDIKPENILLSGNHAVVTDFGIAKALVTARQDQSAGVTIEGLVIGTPAYMAPEQAAGDPHLDQRADLYSLGAVGYEMLAGTPVFSGRTPQALIAAHITEAPAPLDKVKATIPHQLSQLVMFCLAKDPARRPSASAVRTTLESLGPAATTSRRRKMMLTIAAGIVLLAVTSAATGFWPRRSLVARGLFEGHDRILVAEVANRTSDSTLGLAMTQALRVDLLQSDIMRVVGDQEIRAALGRMERAPGTRLTDTVSLELAQREGIKAVIAADISPVGSGYLLSARIVSPADGRELVAARESAADDSELLEALGNLSRELRRRIGESLRSIASTAPLERVTTGSIEALRKYSMGLHALDVQRDNKRGEALLREAIALDSGFAMAWRKLGIRLSNDGKRAQAVAALTAAYRHRERLAGTERTWTEASYYGTVTFENDRAIGAYRAILEADSLDGRAMNNLALQYIRGNRLAQAESLLRRAIAIDTVRITPYTNLMETLVEEGKTTAADSLLRVARRRFGNDPSVDWNEVQIRYLQAGNIAAESVLTRMAAAYSGAPEIQLPVAEVQGILAGQRGARREATRRFQAAKRLALAQDDLESAYNVVFSEALMHITTGQPAAALDLMERALADYPLATMEELDRPNLEYAYLYALAGQGDKARGMVRQFEQIPADLRGRDYPFYRSVQALIAMQDGRLDEATDHLDGIVWDECSTCVLIERAWIADRRSNRDSTIAAYERFLTEPEVDRAYTDAFLLPNALRRLGELYEETGNREKAKEYYGRFVDLWQDADRDLQSQVSETRQRIAALTEEP